ncbi:helix-turn-helix transcriptional regulator [Metabacillus fastidiosus]|uniref:helix-turn-helix domain-containing protein n=1 Tax=Metabacillus fastidiosus TaxID=1458 RepID=UPI002DBC3E82|nr:helix-turn-helix transcriptional regulator [Metabacillus fastidiosus]MEC2074816.1 helix-turn-helix transcriptional regulator [Metabacillus fastidiosus]
MNYLGENIRILRKAKGLTVAELAKLSKSSPASISQIENGKRDATFKLILSIAQALNVEIAVLVTPINENIYKHDIESVINFSDDTNLIIGKSVDISHQGIHWGAVFNLSGEGVLVDTLYIQQTKGHFDFNSFFQQTLNSYLIQQRLRILLWNCVEIDKPYSEVVRDGVEWDTFKQVINHLGILITDK